MLLSLSKRQHSLKDSSVMVRTTKRTDAQRRRRRQQLRTPQGPMFPGNREAQTARNDTLERVMSIIDF